MSGRWRCRMCPAKGAGGSREWQQHYAMAHKPTGGTQSTTFGFAPTYSVYRGRRWLGPIRTEAEDA